MPTPGAARATVLTPKLEKPASWLEGFEAATETMLSSGKLDGYAGFKSVLVAPLPAAATKIWPALRALLMASDRIWAPAAPVQLLFEILAPCRTE